MVYAAVVVSGSQKGDNFLVDRVFTGPFNITAVSQYCGRSGAEEPEQWTGYRRFIFFFSPSLALRACFALRAKYRVCLVWLIECLLCRLATEKKTTRKNRGRLAPSTRDRGEAIATTSMYRGSDKIPQLQCKRNRWREGTPTADSPTGSLQSKLCSSMQR